MGKNVTRALAILLFIIGAVIGIALEGITIVGDFEAMRFGATYRFDAPLKNLACPIIITDKETSRVSVTLTNTSNRAIDFRFRTYISQGSATLITEDNTALPLEAGETGAIYWTITPDDVAFERLILVKIRRFPRYDFPASEGACGVLYVKTTLLTGNQIFFSLATIALVCMFVGVVLWVLLNRPLRARALGAFANMAGLAVCIIAGTIVGMTGNWMFGGIILVLTLLLALTISTVYLIRIEAQ
ncbi:MAG TPA: hypothetical protein G4O08_05865 [Anaerolineae bacterium]|nr:hypothetical protein [Anaerolineae bacterium]